MVPLGLLLIARAVFWVLITRSTEDAYITFRYARHLAEGNGLVYNPGERVMGFSSPLWTLWNAIGFKLLQDPTLWSRVSSIGADTITLVVMARLLERHVSRASAWCFGFFFAAWPYFSAAAVSGMESNALFALVVLTAALIEAGNPLAGPALASIVLMRPEGVAAAGVLAIGARGRDRAVAVVLVAGALWGLWSYFGSILPQSVLAKSRIYGTPGPWAGRFWWEWLSPFVLGRWPTQGETGHLKAASVVMAPAFVVGVWTLWKQRGTVVARAVAASLAIWVGYAVLGVAFFWWYLVVPLAGVVAAAAVGFPQLVRGRAVAIACLLLVLGVWTIIPEFYRARSQVELNSFGRVAYHLEARCRPGDKVMLEPIGMVGYTIPVVVIDEVGLVSPRVAKRRLEGPGWYSDIEARERPDWLVLRQGVMRTGEAFAGAGAPFRSVLERDSLLARYEVVDAGNSESGDLALAVLHRIR